MDTDNCFFCEVDKDLLIDKSMVGLTVAGLGPLVTASCITAHPQHGKFRIKNPDENKEYFLYAQRVRDVLIESFGSCLLAEHGNIQVCREIDATDQYCFHQHFQLFPAAPDILRRADGVLELHCQTSSLADAIQLVDWNRPYILLSENPSKFSIYTSEEIPSRQLARVLLASQLGVPELASWQDNPNRELAIRNAEICRDLLA